MCKVDGCISVIVPLYKGKKYIDHIITNIQKNKIHLHKCKIELIFVNDDPSENIDVQTQKNQGIDIKLITNLNNIGIHASRVKGVKAASGDYILFLDQDDEISEYFLKVNYEALLKASDRPFTICNGVIEHLNYKRPIYTNRVMQLMAQKVIFYALFDNRIMSPGQCLIKKKAIPEFWMCHSLSINGADDLLLWIELLCNHNCKSPKLVFKRLYVHKNTNSNTSLDLSNMYSSVDEMILLLRKYKFSENVLKVFEYRNDLLKEGRSNVSVSLLYAFIIRIAYVYRKRKKTGKRV